jgi:hypothetical protein
MGGFCTPFMPAGVQGTPPVVTGGQVLLRLRGHGSSITTGIGTVWTLLISFFHLHWLLD